MRKCCAASCSGGIFLPAVSIRRFLVRVQIRSVVRTLQAVFKDVNRL